MQTYRRKDAVVLVRRGMRLAVVALTLAGAAEVAVMGRLTAPWAAPLTLATLVGFVGAVLGSVAFVVWPKRLTGNVVADGRGLSVEGRLLWPRAGIQGGYLHSIAGGRLAVRLTDRRKWTPLDVVVADEAEGEAVLCALGLDTAHSAAVFAGVADGTRANVRRTLKLGALLGLGVGVFVFVPHPSFFVATLLFFLPFCLLQLRSHLRLTVGSEGLLVRRFVSTARYLPYDEVVRVEQEGKDVVIALKGGGSMRVEMGDRKGIFAESQGEALVRRIEDARLRHASSSAPISGALLARGARSPRTWVAAVTSLGDDARASYRGASVPREELWRMLEDVASPAEVRAGAAVALKHSLDEEGKERLRVAAEACASPKLRTTFEAVRTGANDAALEEALAALSA